MNNLIFTGQSTPTPTIYEYKYNVPDKLKEEILLEIGKLFCKHFQTNIAMNEFLENEVEVQSIKVRCFIHGNR